MGTLILEVHRQTSTSSRMKCNTLDGYLQVQWIMLFNWMIPLAPYQFLNIYSLPERVYTGVTLLSSVHAKWYFI